VREDPPDGENGHPTPQSLSFRWITISFCICKRKYSFAASYYPNGGLFFPVAGVVCAKTPRTVKMVTPPPKLKLPLDHYILLYLQEKIQLRGEARISEDPHPYKWYPPPPYFPSLCPYKRHHDFSFLYVFVYVRIALRAGLRWIAV
jgi:hypothetical protein